MKHTDLFKFFIDTKRGHEQTKKHIPPFPQILPHLSHQMQLIILCNYLKKTYKMSEQFAGNCLILMDISLPHYFIFNSIKDIFNIPYNAIFNFPKSKSQQQQQRSFSKEGEKGTLPV
jgi:hypothetical protein